MKRNILLIALAILISMPVCGQINIFNAKKKQKELIDALSKIAQEEQATQQAALAPVEKEKEAIEKQYKGQTLYFITDLDYYTKDGYHIDVMSPNDTEKGTFRLRALSGKDAFCVVDTSIVKRNEVISKSAYVCTDVILVNHVDKYGKVPDAVALRLMGKNPDDLTIRLNRGVREYPVVLYVYYSKAQRGVDAGWGTYIYGYNNTYGDILTPKPISVKVKTSLGEIESTYTHPLNLATDADLDSLVLDLQGKYKSKRDAQLAAEIEMKKAKEEAKKRQEEENRKYLEELRLKREYEIARENELREQAERVEREKINALNIKYGEFGTLVYNHQIAIGMSKDACVEAIGEPLRKKVLDEEIQFEYSDKLVIFSRSTEKIINFYKY
ncbi:MAG: hypothetical protein J6Y32_02715 [Bacteroidales bacterium]|nr:hypothetical protein [Bacteroidales bacterium]